MNRKLKKRDVMTISRILHDLSFKEYVEDLMSYRLESVLSSIDTKAENKETPKTKQVATSEQKAKMFIVLGDLFSWLFQNMHKAESNIDKLIKSYKDMNDQQLEDMSIDEYIDTLKEVFIAGIPDVIKSYVDITSLKESLQGLKKTDTES